MGTVIIERAVWQYVDQAGLDLMRARRHMEGGNVLDAFFCLLNAQTWAATAGALAPLAEGPAAAERSRLGDGIARVTLRSAELLPSSSPLTSQDES